MVEPSRQMQYIYPSNAATHYTVSEPCRSKSEYSMPCHETLKTYKTITHVISSANAVVKLPVVSKFVKRLVTAQYLFWDTPAVTTNGIAAPHPDRRRAPTPLPQQRHPSVRVENSEVPKDQHNSTFPRTQTLWRGGIGIDEVQLKRESTRWRTKGEVKGKLANGVGSQYPSHYLGTRCIQHYYRWCAHLGCQ